MTLLKWGWLFLWGIYFVEGIRKKVKKVIFSKTSNFYRLTTILVKIYETNFSVSVKERTTGKVQFQSLNSFLLVLTKFSFWEEDWALGYNSVKIWDLLNIS